MSRYLVTGSAGFIGSKVAQRLLSQDHTVIGIDNFNDAYDPRLKEWRHCRLKDQPRFQFHRLDVCDRKGLDKVFQQGIDGVLNLAARAGVRQSVENPAAYFDTNVTGTLNLLELCKEHGVGKFVLASTSSLYGSENPMPFREDANTDRPLSPYAASKKSAESICYAYHHLTGIDVTILRYFTVYGPAGRPDMSLFRFVQWIAEGKRIKVYGDGTQTRDFTYIDDIAEGTVSALIPVGYEAINLGSDSPVVLNEVIQLIEDLLEKKADRDFEPRHPADVTATWANIEKAERLLKWRPRMPFSAGVANLVEWYRSNRGWARNIEV